MDCLCYFNSLFPCFKTFLPFFDFRGNIFACIYKFCIVGLLHYRVVYVLTQRLDSLDSHIYLISWFVVVVFF